MSFMSFVNFSQFNSDFYEFRIVYEDSGVKRSAFKFILADLLTPESYEYIIGRFPRFIPFLNYMGRFEYFCNRICLAYALGNT